MKTDTTLSRRRLLASIPALAATTAPVAATALSGLPMGDAALLVLGEKLKPLAAEIMAAKALDQTDQDEFEAQLAALGLKDESEYPDGAYMGERCRLIDENSESLNYDRPISGRREWDDLWGELSDLMDDILAITPTTVEGFAVQVLAIVTMHGGVLCSAGYYRLEDFLCRTCEFVGVPIPDEAA